MIKNNEIHGEMIVAPRHSTTTAAIVTGLFLAGRSAAWFSASALGAESREFESPRPDHFPAVFMVFLIALVELCRLMAILCDCIGAR